MQPTDSPSRHLWLAAAAADRHQRLEAWLSERPRAPGTDDDEVVLVAPTRASADDLLRRWVCGPSAGRGLFGIHRLTLPQLASELATSQLAEQRLAPLGVLGSEAMAARAVAHCRRDGGLDYFEPVADSPGFPPALARTLRELRGALLSPAALTAEGDEDPASEDLPRSRSARSDLARLLAAYEEELATSGLIDPPGLLRLARSAITPDHPLVARSLALLDLSPRTAAERDLLGALARAAPAAVATALAGDRVGIDALAEILAVEPTPVGGSTAESQTVSERRLDRLRRHLFVTRPDGDPPSPDDGSFELLTAPGEGRECVEIARRARALAADGTPFDQMAVLLRDPVTYLPLVEESLRRAGIPANFTRGSHRPHAAGRALLALLACAAEDFSATRFAEYLSLGQVPAADETGGPAQIEVPWVAPLGEQLVLKTWLSPAEAAALTTPHQDLEEDPLDLAVDPDAPVVAGSLRAPRRWEQLLVDAAVLGGEERWRRRLAGLGEELRLRLEHLDEDDHPRRQRLELQIEQLGRLERFALPVIAELAALPEQATWGGWLDALDPLAALVLRDAEGVRQVLAELRPMEQVGPIGIDEVLRVLQERLTDLRTEPPKRRHGRIFVASLDEARGHRFQVVFLPGLAEGIFPRRASEDPLLLDPDRRRLDPTLPTRADRVEDERLLLRIAAGAAERRLVVSYPNLDTLQGRSRVPSFYALDLLRAAEGRLPEIHQLEALAVRGTDAILGWPAPRTPQQAIDDGEYDLAIIEPLLRLPIEEARARGRYLLESNEHLTRALRNRYLRWRPKFTSADGLVHPQAAARQALEEHRLHRRSYSPTALQHFAACPYRFLLSAVHRLRPRDEAVWLEQLDPLTRGSLFHQVQFELFGALRDHDLLPLRDDELGTVLDLADRTLDRVARRFEDRLAPAIPRVWASEVEGLRSDLRGWLRTVQAAGGPWRPAHFELSFGLGRELRHGEPDGAGEDPDSQRKEAIVAGGKRLRGAIDLVEVDDARGVLRVTDHKTGLPPRDQRVVIGHGELLQPLLYALAAEVLLGKPVEFGRLFYCTHRGRFEEREVPVTAETRDYISQVLETIDRALVDAFLPAAPREEACKYCDYRLVCGPLEELRLRKKRRDTEHHPNLVRLGYLRKCP